MHVHIEKIIQEKEINFLDIRHTNIFNQCQHISLSVTELQNIQSINLLNHQLTPDLSTYFIDPFTTQPTLVFFANSNHLDARSILDKALNYAQSLGVVISFSFKIEFFLFDDVRWENTQSKCFAIADSTEDPKNNSKIFSIGNKANRLLHTANLPPFDSCHDIRSEIAITLKEIGVSVIAHYHGSFSGQHILHIGSQNPLLIADSFQKLKYAIRQVASSYGKTATFMPQPLGKKISRLYCNIDIDSKLKEKYFLGIQSHKNALLAFFKPTTNSYHTLDDIPDSSINPYLFFASHIMAGIDGITNQDLKNSLSWNDKKVINLRDSLDCLEKDFSFLTKNHVMSNDIIKTYIEFHYKICKLVEETPHPIEFEINYGI